MKKKVLALVLTLSLSVGIAAPVSAANGGTKFTDVPTSSWAYPYVERAAENGWVSGYSNGNYGPNDEVSYAQFAVMVTQAFFREAVDSYQGTDGEAWYLKYTSISNDLGLFKGTNLEGHHTDGSMVGMQLSRYEMGQFLYNTMTAVGIETNVDLSVIASSTSDWALIPVKYQDAVSAVKIAGLISGVDSTGKFSGESTMNRAQAAVVLCKLGELVQEHQQGQLESNSRVTAKVSRVIDGDTIVVNYNGIEETVRMIGVDAPESVHPTASKNTEAGFAASEFTKVFLNEQTVELEFDVQERDMYGRLLAYVYLNGKMFNEKLLETGYAAIATYPPNVKYVERFESIISKRDPSVPSGEYDDGYMKTPSVVYKTLAEENGLDGSFYYEDGIVKEIKDVSGYKTVMLETNRGNMAVLETLEVAAIPNLKKGDSVRVGFLYLGYSSVTDSACGIYMETLKRSEAEQVSNQPSQSSQPNQSSQTTTQNRTVYVTRTGKRYHYNGNCNGGKYYTSTLSEARSRGLTPCSKCVR